MAGLLDIWNERPTEDPYAPMKPMNPMGYGLLNFGAGLLAAPTWGQGMGAGLLGASQAMQNARGYNQDISRYNLQMAELKRQQDQRALWDKIPTPQGMDPNMWAAMDPQMRFQTLTEKPSGAMLTPDQEIAQFGRDMEGSYWGAPGQAPQLIQGTVPTAPDTRTITRGSTEVQQEFVNGQWVDVEGSGGPRWAPQQPDNTLVEVYDPETRMTKWVPRAEAAGLPSGPPDGGNPSEREERIARIVKLQGVDEATAAAVVDGIIEIVIDPVTREKHAVNLLTNESTPLETAIPHDTPGIPQNTGISLYDLATKGTGVLSAGSELYARTIGQLPGMPLPEETLRARQTLETSQQDLIRALAVNPRFPVAEIEAIKSEIEIAPSMWDSPGAMQNRMESIDQSLHVRLEAAERDAANVMLPPETRQAQAANAAAIRNFISILGVPSGGSSIPSGVPEGSKQIGTTQDGLPVWQAPDGKQYVVE